MQLTKQRIVCPLLTVVTFEHNMDPVHNMQKIICGYQILKFCHGHCMCV